MTTITAKDFRTAPRRAEELALREPLMIRLPDGRELVLSTREAFESLRVSEREALWVEELPDAIVERIESQPVPAAARRHDHEVG